MKPFIQDACRKRLDAESLPPDSGTILLDLQLLPQKMRPFDAVIKATNRYNPRAKVVNGCIGEEGSITFWLDRNTGGGAFPEETFACDFIMVIHEPAANIFNEALSER